MMTEAKSKLWTNLKTQRAIARQFRNKHSIGPYIADICSPRRKLIIEVDDSGLPEDYDRRRTAFFESRGYRVLRIWRDDVLLNINGVLGTIREALEMPDQQTEG